MVELLHAEQAHAHSTNRTRSLCVVIVIVLVIAAVGPGFYTVQCALDRRTVNGTGWGMQSITKH